MDLVLPVEVHPDRPELVKLQLRLGDPKLRKDKHKDNEAIQFDFDLVKDNPDKISKELVSLASGVYGQSLQAKRYSFQDLKFTGFNYLFEYFSFTYFKQER